MAEKKPKYGMYVHTDMMDLNMVKIYVKLHLNYREQDKKKVGVVEKWVTGVEHYPTKTFYYKDKEYAHAFYSIGEALDFCVALGVNGYCASVVLAADYNDHAIYYNYPEEEEEENVSD